VLGGASPLFVGLDLSKRLYSTPGRRYSKSEEMLTLHGLLLVHALMTCGLLANSGNGSPLASG